MSKDVDITRSRLPVWAELQPKDQEAVVWDAVYNARSLEIDADDARRAADQMVDLIRRGRRYDDQTIQAARRERRGQALRTIRKVLAILVAVGVVVGGASIGGYAIYEVHANDYAGVDPATVKSDAAAAVNLWFGQNDLPANLQIISQRHAHLYGKAAWLVVYNGDRRGPVCAYVWGGASRDYEKVETGASCSR